MAALRILLKSGVFKYEKKLILTYKFKKRINRNDASLLASNAINSLAFVQNLGLVENAGILNVEYYVCSFFEITH